MFVYICVRAIFCFCVRVCVSCLVRLLVKPYCLYTEGTRLCYQSFTFSMYIDALIRRVDPQHRNLSQFFREEIALPYGNVLYLASTLVRWSSCLLGLKMSDYALC